jgi:hypothetical protein
MELLKISQKALSHLNWFFITLFIAILVYGIAGLPAGRISGAWIISILIPVISCLIKNPVLQFPMARNLPLNQKTAIIVMGQFMPFCTIAFWGCIVKIRSKKKKEASKKRKNTKK